MNATITQNAINLLNNYNAPVVRENSTDDPTVFSNAPDVDGGRNVITMSTGQFNNNVYTRVPNIASQKLLRIARNSRFATKNNSKDHLTVYNYDLTNTMIYVEYAGNYSYMDPAYMARPEGVSDLFDSRTYGVIPMLCNGDDPITLDTSDVNGDIISYSNNILSTTYNEDGSITVVYRSTVPSNVTNFTLKSILFSTAGAGGPSNKYSVSNLPPIIMWGLVLDTPIELEANDSVKISVTYKTNFTS